MDKNRTMQLDASAAAIRQQLHAVEAEQEAAALQLAAKPGDAALLATVGDIGQRAEGYRKQLESLELARSAAANADGKDARAARRNARRATRKRIEALYVQRGKALVALVAHAEAFGPLLAAYEAPAIDIRSLVTTYVRETENDLPHSRQALTVQAIDLTNRPPDSQAFGAALWLCGLGRVGLELEPLGTTIAPPPWKGAHQEDLHGATRRDAEEHWARVAALLDRADLRLQKREQAAGDDIEPPTGEAHEPRELVAHQRGFYGGQMVDAGTAFSFVGPTVPAWAHLANAPRPNAAPVSADIKPAEAQAAVRRKANEIHDSTTWGTDHGNP